MSAIITPSIPSNTYPTNDTLITMTIDTDEIMAATTQEAVMAAARFTDNRRQSTDEGPNHQTMLVKNNFVTWVGAVQDVKDHPLDKVLIYDVTGAGNAWQRKEASSGPGQTHVDGKSKGSGAAPEDYTIVFWVWNNNLGLGKAFQIDPKLGVNN